MDKMQLAHDMALAMAADGNVPNENIVAIVWQYADAMQAEADKRSNTERPKVLFEPKLEVDWRVAPCWAKEWVMRNGVAKWECGVHADSWEDAPSFGFTGSHIMERPE
jgi:hypothetical protein